MYPHQRERLGAVLAARNLAALITTAPINIAWATSTTPTPAPAPRVLVAARSGSVLLVGADDPHADTLNADDVVRYGTGERTALSGTLATTLSALGIAPDDAVALEADGGEEIEESDVRAGLGARDVIPGAALWREARAVKSPFELECLERGLVILEESMNAAVQALAPGMTSRQTVEICRREGERHGLVFEHMVAASLRGSRRGFRAGDVLRLELAGSWRGYHATVARAAVLGTPDPDQERAHAVLEAALDAAVGSVAPGVPGSVVHAAAPAKDTGAAVSGGGIGLESAELPVITADASTPLEPGMVLAICAEGASGVRLIDTVLVTSRGSRRLNRSQAGLVALD